MRATRSVSDRGRTKMNGRSRQVQEGESVINTLLDACRFVLEDQGEALSASWLASLMEGMKLWRASESRVRAALDRDIRHHGESSRFVKVAEDLYALRSWKAR
jgi:HB1, ASXL, restriction endonuclease HTH domain